MPLNVHHLSSADGINKFELMGVVSRDEVSRADPLIAACGGAVYGQLVLFDLSKVTHIDSTGLEWLLVCHSHCTNGGGKLVLHSLTPMTRGLVELMRLDLVLQIVDSEQEALALSTSVENGDGEGGE